MASPFLTPEIATEEFTNRLAGNFPPGWSSPEAKMPGGVLYGVLLAIGGQLTGLMGIPFEQDITISGIVTPGDTVSLSFVNSNLSTSPLVVNYLVVAGDDITGITNQLANLISSNSVLSAVGIRALALQDGLLKVFYPTIPKNIVWTTGVPPANTMTVYGTSNGTEIVTVG